ncbi:MAG: sulfatase-like hydrolase/transferase [Polyangiaceae bacterium]|nr:sulfatase-like hydrolase/transferase [Polyangiaceae bacterium]
MKRLVPRGRASRFFLAMTPLLLPTAWVFFGEVARRGRHIAGLSFYYQKAFWGGIIQSFVFWGVLVYAASRRDSFLSSVCAGLFFMLFVVIMGTEGAFFAMWNTYLGVHGQIHSKNFVQSIVGTLPLERGLVMFHFAAAFAAASIILVTARRVVEPGKWKHRIGVLLVPGVIYGSLQIPTSYQGVQASPPDALYIHGLRALADELRDITNESPDLRVQRRKPEPVPDLEAHPSRQRNVLLIVQESQRGDVVCVEPDRRCDRATPWTNAVVPNRLPLMQLRSNASTTAISISNIWSGVPPIESRELLHSVPLLWDYAHAAGWDNAYWTSQNLMFGNARQYIQDLPISHGCIATHLDMMADLDFGAHDELVTERVKEEWSEMKEPFFAVVHYSNVHYPYVYDEELAPFRPSEMDKSADKNTDFFNYYKNVVHRSDLNVAEMIRAIRETDAGKRTVIVYTSDHGESFREHWQMGHTSALFDEEVLVQGWIDAPPGTLSPEEEESIRNAKQELVWHLDLAPTLLDLMGLWDEPKMAPFKARMIGHPITRPERTVQPVPMTNCTWVWECSFRNWGLMQGSRKVEAREWDGTYHCFDVVADPEERVDLGERTCAPLPDLAREMFPAMPNVTPPGRAPVDWGK